MYLLGYSLDNFSLMALTIATGFVVDDAIVVMENTTRHIESGHEAACRPPCWAPARWASPCISMSLSLVAVFLPFQFARRHRRPAVPRIHGDPVGGHPDLAGHLADHDADDVLAAAAARARPQAARASAQASSAASSRLRSGYERTLGLGPESSAAHGAVAAGDHRASTSICTSSSRRDSSRSRTPASCRAASAAMRPLPSS